MRVFGLSLQDASDIEPRKGSHSPMAPNTNTILTCYGELGIPLRVVYRITRLPILGEMHDEFFLTNKLIMI